MDIKETVDYQIKLTGQAMLKMYNQIANQFGFTQSAGLILLSISKEGTPATSIADSLGMEVTSMSRIMNSLEENKLIYREKDKNDKRMVRTFLTEEGVAKRKIAKKMVEGFNELIQHKIPQSKLSLFNEVMLEINQSIDEYKEQNRL